MSRGARFTLDQLPEKARLEVLAQIAAEDKRRQGRLAVDNPIIQVLADVPSEVLATKKRMRQSGKPLLNKLETSYRDEILYKTYKPDEVYAQAVRVKLCNGDWYKPDFFIPSANLFVEVKGPKAFRGGFEFLKMAASVHPFFTFKLVWIEKRGGPWQAQIVLK